MESEQDPVEPAPPRRKPRARTPKTPRPLAEPPAPEPFPEEFPQEEDILDPSGASGASREPEVFSRLDLALPVFALAFVLFLLSQVVALRQNAGALAWQALNLKRQAESLQGVRDNVAGRVQQRQTLADESQRITANYNELLNDLIKLAETDKDARAVVEKFHIKSGASTPTARAPKK